MRFNTVNVSAVSVAIVAALMLIWLMSAVGIIGIEGDPAALMYFAVLTIGISGAIVAPVPPDGMFAALFVGSALLFRIASAQQSRAETRPMVMDPGSQSGSLQQVSLWNTGHDRAGAHSRFAPTGYRFI